MYLLLFLSITLFLVSFLFPSLSLSFLSIALFLSPSLFFDHFDSSSLSHTHTVFFLSLSLFLTATNSNTGFPFFSTTSPFSLRCHRVTMGSAAWLGPQRPSSPRPTENVLCYAERLVVHTTKPATRVPFIPVRPHGFCGTPPTTAYVPEKLRRSIEPSIWFHFAFASSASLRSTSAHTGFFSTTGAV